MLRSLTGWKVIDHTMMLNKPTTVLLLLAASGAPALMMAQKVGRTTLSEADQMKVMAIESLMQTDSERALAALDKLIQNVDTSPEVKRRALNALAVNRSPKAREALIRTATTKGDLQAQAVQMLGIHRDPENLKALDGIYAAAGSDAAVKKQVLRGWMASGNKDQLLNVAKSDGSPEMRMEAVQMPGALGGGEQLAALYSAETSTDVRGRILQSMMASGSGARLMEIAKAEKDAGLRDSAIRYMGSVTHPATLRPGNRSCERWPRRVTRSN